MLKEKKSIDYSKVPPKVFDKAWAEVVDMNRQIEADLKSLGVALGLFGV